MLWMRHIDHIFIIWTTTDVMDETTHRMRHIIYSLYGQQPMLWMRHIDHIFIIWTTTDVMDERH